MSAVRIRKPSPYTTPCSLPPLKQLPIKVLSLARVHKVGSEAWDIMWAQC